MMEKYLPSSWRLAVNKRTGSLGLCFPHEKLIEISIHTINAGEETFTQTLLHEIAHALDFIRNGNTGHGESWKEIMVELGLEPNRTASRKHSKAFAENIQYKYNVHCENPDCDNTFNRMRRAKATHNWLCGKCAEKGIMSEFVWVKNF